MVEVVMRGGGSKASTTTAGTLSDGRNCESGLLLLVIVVRSH
jgi:hypothetical protein